MKINLSKVAIIIVLVLFFLSNSAYCLNTSLKNKCLPDSLYDSYLNLSYGNASENANLLDIYLPKNHSSSTKLIIFIHGGFWSKGGKNQLPKPLINMLVTQKGYGMVSINYRLVKENDNRFPAQIEDVSKAIEFLSKKGDSLAYNQNEFALLGASAGAHLALLYAYAFDTKKQIKTVIDIVGPTDLSDSLVRNNNELANITITKFLGESNPKAKIAHDASPIFQLSKESGVPTIIFHGENDEVVHVNQAKALYQKLTSLGIQTQIELYPNETHEMKKSLMSVFSTMSQWLEKVYPAK
ncbi:alpha/beta hydrolase fold domain-containing protein [Emticicia sp. SJ17W-69]|uniref:alpha/beta hydrolase fold domain-containing protein n=1 Tax=Emticicia sp. SJ17W-69 TaxID=3421657 RepID=UPI003EBC574D